MGLRDRLKQRLGDLLKGAPSAPLAPTAPPGPSPAPVASKPAASPPARPSAAPAPAPVAASKPAMSPPARPSASPPAPPAPVPAPVAASPPVATSPATSTPAASPPAHPSTPLAPPAPVPAPVAVAPVPAPVVTSPASSNPVVAPPAEPLISGGDAPLRNAHLRPTFHTTPAALPVRVVNDALGIDISFSCEPGEYVLEAADRAGHELPSSCRNGGCLTCTGRLLDGEAAIQEDQYVLEEEHIEAGFRLLCITAVTKGCTFHSHQEEAVQ